MLWCEVILLVLLTNRRRFYTCREQRASWTSQSGFFRMRTLAPFYEGYGPTAWTDAVWNSSRQWTNIESKRRFYSRHHSCSQNGRRDSRNIKEILQSLCLMVRDARCRFLTDVQTSAREVPKHFAPMGHALLYASWNKCMRFSQFNFVPISVICKNTTNKTCYPSLAAVAIAPHANVRAAFWRYVVRARRVISMEIFLALGVIYFSCHDLFNVNEWIRSYMSLPSIG